MPSWIVQAFIGSTDRAKSLLYALLRQMNGHNNGRLQLTNKWLSEHGWPSHCSNSKAINELIERGLVVVSRLGGLNAGCNWYAVTWLPISNFSNLDISAQTYHQGAWADCKLPPSGKRKPPGKQEAIPTSGTEQKQKNHPGYRDSAIPAIGTGEQFTIPVVGTKKSIFDQSAVPVYGNNVSIPYTPSKIDNGKKRIVGKSRSRGTVN